MRRLPLLLAALLLGVTTSACGYFNSYYNAQRRFGEAERAAQRGEREAAISAYRSAVDRAAVSYRNHPNSRWADDALLLVGRARFAVEEYPAARAALGRVLELSQDEGVRALAQLYLGASLVALGHPDSALEPLTRGLAAVETGSDPHRFGSLWQGRARLHLGDPAGWAALESAARREDLLAVDASLELAGRAIAHHDSARGRAALARLVEMRPAQLRGDSVIALLRAGEAAWGAAAVAHWLTERAAQSWDPDARTRLRIQHAQITAAAGDTALAVRQLNAAVQSSAGPTAAEGRQLAARWLLARLEHADELPQVRAILLPGVPHPGVVLDVRRLRTLELLLDRARGGQSAALFAAAELARDTLAAPRLARELFLAYADVAAGTVWAPKALLAALDLSADAERGAVLQRLDTFAHNPYVAAVQGQADAGAYADAEERLGRAVAAAREDAVAQAISGDVRVTRAVTTLDSIRLSARTDSLRVRCGTLLDSLALRGVRGDSVRAACVRGDSANVTRYLAIDTALLRLRPGADSARRGVPAPRDTLAP